MLLRFFTQLRYEEYKAWWEHWLGLIQRLLNCNLDRGGCRPSVASRMKFFVTTVSGRDSLAFVTKKVNFSSNFCPRLTSA